MRPFKYDGWVAFGFTVVLSAIAMVTLVATGNSGAWIPAFIGFLPMSFFFTAVANGKTREQVRALEARLAQLESSQPDKP